MRHLVVMTAVAGAIAGCTYRRVVRAPELGALHGSQKHGDVVLRTTSPWRARLSPTSQIRFRNGDGKWTDWLPARGLYVDERGVFTDGRIPIADASVAAEIGGLDARGVRALERTAPRPGAVARDGEIVRITASGAELAAWMQAFITEVARDHDPQTPVGLCGPEREPAPGCSMGEYDQRARARLAWNLGGEPLGVWRFAIAGRGWSGAVRGPSLYRAIRGYATRVGWRWDEVTAAEVESLSGARTLGGLVGSTALAAALAPLAALGALGPALSFPAHMDDVPAASHASSTGGSQLLRALGPGPRRVEPGTWAPAAADRQALLARPLFDRGASRRATVRVVIAGEVAAPVTHVDRVMDGVIVAARLSDLIEIGGSVRHLAARGLIEPDRWSSRILGGFYLGGHFFFDAYQRVAAPIAIEAGGSSAGGFFRLRWGLRVRVRDRWFAGVYPLNPTFLGNDSSPKALPHWSFPTGVEFGLSF